MDPIRTYLAAKAAASRANDWAASLRQAPRRPLPRFVAPREAWSYWEAHGAPYSGDPLWGLADFYLHPQRTQALLEGVPGAAAPVDCDDLAVWAAYCLRQTDGIRPRIVTLVDAALVGSHVICVGEGPGRLRWAIDTNGYSELPDLEPATLLEEWGRIYPDTAYVAAIETPYPFEEG